MLKKKSIWQEIYTQQNTIHFLVFFEEIAAPRKNKRVGGNL